MSRDYRWRITVISSTLLAILVAGVSFTNTLAAVGDPPQQPRAVRLMTYNIHHGAGNDTCTPPPPTTPPQPDCGLDLQRIATVIRSYDPDLVGLQEVDRFWTRSASVDQPAWLAAELGMHACYGANLQHAPDRHSTIDHEYGTAILSRYPILDCKNTLLPKLGVAAALAPVTLVTRMAADHYPVVADVKLPGQVGATPQDRDQ